LEIVAGGYRLAVDRLMVGNSRFLFLDRLGALSLARFFRGVWLHDSRSPFSLRRGITGAWAGDPISAGTLRRQSDLARSAHAVDLAKHLIPGQTGTFEHDFLKRTAG